MKFNMKTFLLISLVFAVSISSISCMALSAVDSIYTAQEKEFYSNKRNFESIKCVFDRVENYKNTQFLYVESIESDHYFRNLRFTIDSDSLSVLNGTDFFDNIHKGDDITVIIAYAYFGDGYDIPLAGISGNGKVYLDFDTGWECLMEKYK